MTTGGEVLSQITQIGLRTIGRLGIAVESDIAMENHYFVGVIS